MTVESLSNVNHAMDQQHHEVEMTWKEERDGINEETDDNKSPVKNDYDDYDSDSSTSVSELLDTMDAPDDISYHPGRFLLYSRPRQRQKWGETQVLPRVDWGDLFMDLFYVAAMVSVTVMAPSKSKVLLQ